MGRRGNPYDNAKAESFMKTLKVEAVTPSSIWP
jgi:putative transposase